MIVVGIILVCSVIVVLTFPRITKRRILGPREKLSDKELAALFAASKLPESQIVEVLRAMGSGYGIEYSTLRPEDCIVTQLSKIDSWRFDAGAEKVAEIADKYDVKMPSDVKAFSILDLMRLIESKRRESLPPSLSLPLSEDVRS